MVIYGPMQFLIIEFPGNEFTRDIFAEEIIPAIADAREKGLIRVIDSIFLKKDKDGNLSESEGTNLGPTEVEQLGAVLNGLIGLGSGGLKGAIQGAKAGAEKAKEMMNEKTYGLSQEDIDELVDSLPNDSLAVFVLLEHLWAKDLKQAVITTSGRVLIQGLVEPELLVSIGETLKAPTERSKIGIE